MVPWQSLLPLRPLHQLQQEEVRVCVSIWPGIFSQQRNVNSSLVANVQQAMLDGMHLVKSRGDVATAPWCEVMQYPRESMSLKLRTVTPFLTACYATGGPSRLQTTTTTGRKQGLCSMYMVFFIYLCSCLMASTEAMIEVLGGTAEATDARGRLLRSRKQPKRSLYCRPASAITVPGIPQRFRSRKVSTSVVLAHRVEEFACELG